ncbi:DNA (cytosine-5-)-methyltransferase (plasmid) [Clostridium perfringens]
MINIEYFIEIHNEFVKVREATKQGYAIARIGDSVNLEQPNSKTRRGRVGKQIANTLTCSCNQGVVVKEELIMNELRVVGNTVPSNHTAGRIFDIDGISPTVMYRHSKVVQILENKRRGNYMWKNELERFDFKMDEIKLFDAFAGKGALHKSLKKLGIPTKVVGLSEVEPDAIIAYAGVHIKGFKDLIFDFPSDEEMRKLLMSRNIGWDFIKQKSSIPRMKKDKLKLLYKATILTNNLGDISKLDYYNMFDFDLFNLSFPYTDLSGAGKQKGLKNEDGTHTRSGLIKFGLDIIKAKKPKYIMIENVKALIQKKFINDFYEIINEIESMGYKCFYPTKEDKKGEKQPYCLNAKDYGIPQNRERIFVICVRNDVNVSFEFPKGFDKGIRLKDLLEDNVDNKYYLSEEIQNRFKLNGKIDLNHNELNVVGSSAPECRTIGQRDMTYGINGIMSTLTATDYKQPKQIIDNKYYITDVRKEFLKKEREWGGSKIKTINKIISGAITTREGLTGCDSSNYICKEVGEDYSIKNKNIKDLKIRKLTPLECWRLMGFDDEDFYRTKELGLSDSSLYKLAGNSIVVNCLYYIFKEVFKEYIINKEEDNTYIKTA